MGLHEEGTLPMSFGNGSSNHEDSETYRMKIIEKVVFIFFDKE